MGAARLLYGMGRQQRASNSFFWSGRCETPFPRNNVYSCGASSRSAWGVSDARYGLGAEILNFGALIAFMGVNAAALMRYYVRQPEKKLTNLVPPVLGFVICLLLWLNLSTPQRLLAASGWWPESHSERGKRAAFAETWSTSICRRTSNAVQGPHCAGYSAGIFSLGEVIATKTKRMAAPQGFEPR